MNAGLSNPKRSVMICIAMLVIGVGGILWGVFEMNRLGGAETGGTAIAIGGGLLLAIIGFLFMFNFIWAVRLTEAMKRGENVIARWTVPPQTLEEFRADEAERKKAGRGNDWKVPRQIPQQGVEVIFSSTAVMIGESFFGLAKSGIARFTGVAIVPGNPLSIAFGMALTAARGISGGMVVTTYRSELRIPVARTANDEAGKVLAHYTAVTAGQTVARPGFWKLRIKIGLWAAAIGAVSAAAGFGLNALKVDLAEAPMVMAVVGIMLVLFGCVLAAAAALLGRHERADGGR